MIVYKDTCRLVQTAGDGYGDRTITNDDQIPCLFLQSTGNARATNVEIANSDAHIYLDPEHPQVFGNGFRLEGMHIEVFPLGQIEMDSSWYRVTKVVVGQRKLLENNVDNVHAYLRRVTQPTEVVS